MKIKTIVFPIQYSKIQRRNEIFHLTTARIAPDKVSPVPYRFSQPSRIRYRVSHSHVSEISES